MTSQTQITLTISLVMIVLFVIAVIGFSIGFANDNDAEMNIADDPELSSFYTGAREDLADYKTDSEETYSSILKTTIEPGSDVAQSSGSFAITAGNVLGVIKNIVYLPYQKILGSGQGFGVFITTFIAILVFVIGLLIYKSLRGSP